jgi:4-hydroxybenzoate polyprenyltransferase
MYYPLKKETGRKISPMPWLQLIRWKNLLIIYLTQWIAWRCVVVPLHPETLVRNHFFCLALSTILIAAAGYVINDYFDVPIDSVNKPGQVIVGGAISIRIAIFLYIIFNVIAMLLAGYVAIQAHHIEWLSLQGGCILLLWFYSTYFKRRYMVGNITVALLAALTIIALIIYEPAIFSTRQAAINYKWILPGYAFFAFMLTWMREVVKDMEDVEGDARYHCTTMPLTSGMVFSSRFIKTLGAATIIFLLAFCYHLLIAEKSLQLIFILAAVILPLVAWSAKFNSNNSKQQYHSASQQLKLIMLLGIFSLTFYMHG